MSFQAEWMKKYNEIGQKGNEGITTVSESGQALTTEQAPRPIAITPDDNGGGSPAPAPAAPVEEDPAAASGSPDPAPENEAAPAPAVEEEVEEEEIVVDEDGNEIVEEEEVLVDEDGNVVEDEVVVIDEDGNEVKESEAFEEVIEDSADQEDVEAQRQLLHRSPKKDRSVMAGIIPCFLFLACVAAGLLVAFYVFDVLEDEKGPTQAPAPNFLPLGPTNIGAIDVAETTPMDPVQGNCDFSTLEMPHVIDQCACGTAINKIAPDVQSRYEILLPYLDDWVGPSPDLTLSSCSASNQALIWLSSGLNNGGEISEELRRDRYLTAHLYLDHSGESWTDSDKWLTSDPVCRWDRVSCDDQGSIIGFDLQDNMLEGQLSKAVERFEYLEFISVRENNIVGTIPEALFSSSTLKSIDFFDNGFYGELPTFGADIPLETLHLGRNNLSGKINDLKIENARSLSRMDISSNSLNGGLPAELFDLPLAELSIHSNLLSGSIPNAIGKTTSLTRLNIGGNGFAGTLPMELDALTNLEELLIRDSPELTGRLSTTYGLAFKNLVTFVVTGTGMTSDFPASFGSMSSLEHIDFSRNSFRGDLPSEIGKLTNLEKLALYDNEFDGSIPAHTGNMTALEELLLEGNNFTGDVPTELGKLEKLRILTLQDNDMGGRASDGVCDLRDEALTTFVVDCPERDDDEVFGIICQVPKCCTSCE